MCGVPLNTLHLYINKYLQYELYATLDCFICSQLRCAIGGMGSGRRICRITGDVLPMTSDTEIVCLFPSDPTGRRLSMSV
jgi:hypothetical protein